MFGHTLAMPERDPACNIISFHLYPEGQTLNPGDKLTASAIVNCSNWNPISRFILDGGQVLSSDSNGDTVVGFDNHSTNGLSAGGHSVCLQVKENSQDWSQAIQQCKSFTISGGGGSNPTSVPTGQNQATGAPSTSSTCSVMYFYLTAEGQTLKSGDSFTVQATVNCSDWNPISRLLLDNQVISSDSGGDSNIALYSYSTSGLSAGGHSLCIQVKENSQDWTQAAQRCKSFTIGGGSGGNPPTHIPIGTNQPQTATPSSGGGRITQIVLNEAIVQQGNYLGGTVDSKCPNYDGNWIIVLDGNTMHPAQTLGGDFALFWINTQSWSIGQHTLTFILTCNGVNSDSRQYTITVIGTGQIVPTTTPQFQPTQGIQPTAGTAPRFPNAQYADGGINVNQYCIDLGFDREEHSNQDAYSFRCVHNQTAQYLNWNQVCMDVYGSSAPYPRLDSWMDLGGWKCATTPGYVDPPGRYNPATATSQPTNVPPTQGPNPTNPSQPTATSGVIMCGGSAYLPNSNSTFRVSWNPSEKALAFIWCTDYVRSYFMSTFGLDISHCAYGNAWQWKNTAASCNWLVDGFAGPNEIAVWTANCPLVDNGTLRTGSDGHVAVVISVTNDNHIVVNDANWNGDGQIHYGGHYPIETCMSFIHVPLNGQGGGPSTWISSNVKSTIQVHVSQLEDGARPASEVIIPCGPCSTSGAWANFVVPHGATNVSLGFAYVRAGVTPPFSWSLSSVIHLNQSDGDHYDFNLDSYYLGLIIGSGEVNLDELQNPYSWYVTYSGP